MANKTLLDAMADLLTAYGEDVPCRVCKASAGHTGDCAWLTIRAWHADTQGMVDEIRRKAGAAPDHSRPAGQSSLPREMIERERQ